MRKKAIAVVILFLIITTPAVSAWSLRDLLKGSISAALDLFKREVMPVDGYRGIKLGESFVIEGAHWYNPDYYVRLDNATVEFSWWIPRHVDVKVTVYKVYFGIIALHYATYEDIWWTREKVGEDGWIGAFFVWGFDWKRSGVSQAEKAYIAYNLPAANDLGVKNVTILQNETVLLDFDNYTKELSFEDFEGFGNITVVNVTYKHIIGPLYLVRKKDGGDE